MHVVINVLKCASLGLSESEKKPHLTFISEEREKVRKRGKDLPFSLKQACHSYKLVVIIMFLCILQLYTCNIHKNITIAKPSYEEAPRPIQ